MSKRIEIGSGSDVLRFVIDEDLYQGDAQYTISVDGQQIGGTQTAYALNDVGRYRFLTSDQVTVRGDWAPGAHVATVNFLNDAWGGTPETDRNLYVDLAYYNGEEVSAPAQALLVGGPASFAFTDDTPIPPPPVVATVGSGPDTLSLRVSQDAYQGDAQFTVSVDGQQVGGVLTASALRGDSAFGTVNVLGNWGAGPHAVTVDFLNDAWDGTSATDRNLYVDSASYNNVIVDGASLSLFQGGPASFGFTDPGNTIVVSTGTVAASQLNPAPAPGDTLVVRSDATVTAEGDQLSGVRVGLLGDLNTSAPSNLTLTNATVGTVEVSSLSDIVNDYAHNGHADIYGRTTFSQSIVLGGGSRFDPLGYFDAYLHGLNGAVIQGSARLTINGDQGSTVENNGSIRTTGSYFTGSVDIQANLQGAGTVSGSAGVGGGLASIRLGGDVGAGQTIDLTEANLRLDQPMRFMGTLTGLDSGENMGRNPDVTLSNETVTGTSFQQSSSGLGDLSVFTQDAGAAGETLVFRVAGSFASDAFTFTNNAATQSATITLAS